MTKRWCNIVDTIRFGVLAGGAGGLAEITWVLLYAVVTGGDAAILARGVTVASGASALLLSAPVTTGILVHMILAVLLGIALTGLWRTLAPSHGTGSLYALALAALAGVWVLNFFLILPAISPAFVHLVPYSVSLLSKLLFGLAAAEVLRRCTMGAAAAIPVRVRTASWTRRPRS